MNFALNCYPPVWVMFIFASSAMQYATCLSLVMTHVYYVFMKHPPSLCLLLANIPSVSLN